MKRDYGLFIKDILFEKIGAKEIFVGENFRFGRNAGADANTLKSLAPLYNYRVKVFSIIRIGNKTVSSTYIRSLIKKGKLYLAGNLLARPVSILGTVISGMRVGRRLGFPTANIEAHHEVIPPKGIYAVEVIVKGNKFYGTCYIGSRPTFTPQSKKVRVEVNIFNLNKSIYGDFLELQFIKKIRKDKRFNSASLLAKQIERDTLKTKRLFSLPKVLPQ